MLRLSSHSLRLPSISHLPSPPSLPLPSFSSLSFPLFKLPTDNFTNSGNLRLMGGIHKLNYSTKVGSSGHLTHVPPHGGHLVNLMCTESEKNGLIKSAEMTLEINERQSCDVQLITNGAFSPLTGFMNFQDYNSVLETMRIPDSNVLFGLPVVLDTYLPKDKFKLGQKILLKFQNCPMAILTVEDIFVPNKPKECKLAYGTTQLEHPGVRMVAQRGQIYLGGSLVGLETPKRIYPTRTPLELREMLPSRLGHDVVAFQCRNPIHRAHYELFTKALFAENVKQDVESVVLVHPTCGPTQEDDISGEVRFQTYEVLKKAKPDPRVLYDYLPYSMHMAGPREAIQHMIMRKNYGCTHFIIGRDMAGSKSSLTGEDYYGAYDAQDLAKKHEKELGIKVVPSKDLVYTEEKGYVEVDVAKKEKLHVKKLSGTEFRRKLRAGEDIPEWFAFKPVVDVLRSAL